MKLIFSRVLLLFREPLPGSLFFLLGKLLFLSFLQLFINYIRWCISSFIKLDLVFFIIPVCGNWNRTLDVPFSLRSVVVCVHRFVFGGLYGESFFSEF